MRPLARAARIWSPESGLAFAGFFFADVPHRDFRIFRVVENAERGGIPMTAFRLVASDDTIKARILGRDRVQKAEELENALRQQAEFDRLFADESLFTSLDTDGLDVREVAGTIVKRLRA